MMTAEEAQTGAAGEGSGQVVDAAAGKVEPLHVLVDGVEHIAYCGIDNVMFEKDGKVWGIMRNKFKMSKFTDDRKGLILAWESNGEIKSVEIRGIPGSFYENAPGAIRGVLGT